MAGYQVSIVARARFNRSTKYHVAVDGMSYGRCKKYWNDFEELYDSLLQTHGAQLESIPFPTYVTRRDHSKQEQVEANRRNLENLLASLLRHSEVSRSEAVLTFLQLTEFVNGPDEDAHCAAASTSREALSTRPGPTPATVKPVFHSTALDEADDASSDEDFTPALDERDGVGRGGAGRGAEGTREGSKGGRPTPSESSNTIWIGR